MAMSMIVVLFVILLLLLSEHPLNTHNDYDDVYSIHLLIGEHHHHYWWSFCGSYLDIYTVYGHKKETIELGRGNVEEGD